MTITNVNLETLAKLTARINTEVTHAIALQSVWVRCADKPDVPHALSNEFAFPIIRDSVQIELLMTLARLYEVRSRQKKTATIYNAIQLLNKEHGSLDSNARSYAEQANDKYDQLVKTEIPKRILDLRDKALAHNDKCGPSEQALYGDETKLLEHTETIACLLHQAVTGNHPQHYRQEWIRFAESFWTRAMHGDGNSR